MKEEIPFQKKISKKEEQIMKTVKISLNSIDKVKAFVNEVTKFDAEFDLVSGRYVIDAKCKNYSHLSSNPTSGYIVSVIYRDCLWGTKSTMWGLCIFQRYSPFFLLFFPFFKSPTLFFILPNPVKLL